MDAARWAALTRSLGVADADPEYAKLESAYAQPGRHYHGTAHVDDCLARFDEFRDAAERPAEVEIALWFHDAVYVPGSATNEIESAEWARAFLSRHGVDEAACDRVHGHVLATRHTGVPAPGDAALVVDLDLSILGRSEAEYARFEENIRREYAFVPLAEFGARRAGILRSFLDRDVIYAHEAVRDVYESNARRNLRAAIARLSA